MAEAARVAESTDALRERVDARQRELIDEWRVRKQLDNHMLSSIRVQAVIEVFSDRIARLEDEVRQLKGGT